MLESTKSQVCVRKGDSYRRIEAAKIKKRATRTSHGRIITNSRGWYMLVTQVVWLHRPRRAAWRRLAKTSTDVAGTRGANATMGCRVAPWPMCPSAVAVSRAVRCGCKHTVLRCASFAGWGCSVADRFVDRRIRVLCKEALVFVQPR